MHDLKMSKKCFKNVKYDLSEVSSLSVLASAISAQISHANTAFTRGALKASRRPMAILAGVAGIDPCTHARPHARHHAHAHACTHPRTRWQPRMDMYGHIHAQERSRERARTTARIHGQVHKYMHVPTCKCTRARTRTHGSKSARREPASAEAHPQTIASPRAKQQSHGRQQAHARKRT